MKGRVEQVLHEPAVGIRVDTEKYGWGTLSGIREVVGRWVRYEVVLDEPCRWSCHKASSTGPFFVPSELKINAANWEQLLCVEEPVTIA